MLELLACSARRNTARRSPACGFSRSRGFTLVEMLIAMAITLIMMAAVVTVFANVSDSFRNRRASIEMNAQVRHVREVLQRDLAGATCPGLPFQRPESNHGYIEIIEGPQSDFDPSIWLQDNDDDGAPDDIDTDSGPLPPIDLTVSALPSSNRFTLPGATIEVTDNTGSNEGDPNAVTDGRGLGDWDDALALTVRNEDEPFVGRLPVPFDDNNGNGIQDGGETVDDFADWGSQTVESQLAEVIWFAVENPVEATPTFYFGEPGFRTVYRRVLLVAPQTSFGFDIGGTTTGAGVVRVLNGSVDEDEVDQAMAAIIAFQDRYDLSVRLEWDPQLGNDGRWTIVANSLADLTKRENRFEHYGFIEDNQQRRFPFAAASLGAGYNNGDDLVFVTDPELAAPDTRAVGEVLQRDGVQAYTLTDAGEGYVARPFVYVDEVVNNPGPVRAIMNEDNEVVAVTSGFVPLGGSRRGEDVMLTDVLAFDLRVFDPDAPLLAEIADQTDANFPGSVIEPSDAGWGGIVRDGDGSNGNNTASVDLAPVIVSRGAYVDLGYYFRHYTFLESTDDTNDDLPDLNNASLDPETRTQIQNRLLNDSLFSGSPLARSGFLRFNSSAFTPFRVYDTWSFHYENNGINEDRDSGPGGVPTFDEGTDGFDNPDPRQGGNPTLVDNVADIAVLGPDDAGEFETSPPYNAPLRGVQVTVRGYERDSRQIREVTVSQTFVPQ